MTHFIFDPGDVIRSTQFNTNFTNIYDKPILIPVKQETAALSGVTSYTVPTSAYTALKALGDITYLDIVDVLDANEDLLYDGSDIVYGRIDTLTPTVLTVGFYKQAYVPVSVTQSTAYLQIPILSTFEKLPQDFLRTEFVNKFEQDIGTSLHVKRDKFTPNGIDTEFTLSVSSIKADSESVYLNGLMEDRGTNTGDETYQIGTGSGFSFVPDLTGNVIKFAEAPHTTHKLIITYHY